MCWLTFTSNEYFLIVAIINNIIIENLNVGKCKRESVTFSM